MPANSRMSAWFVTLVALSGSVFLLEYVVYFNTDFRDYRELQGSTPLRRMERVGTAREEEEQSGERLAVIVPAHRGDLAKALSSLAKWPSTCHPSTLRNADLVLYYAGGEEDDVSAVLPSLAKTGGRCFAETRLVLANLRDEVRPLRDADNRSTGAVDLQIFLVICLHVTRSEVLFKTAGMVVSVLHRGSFDWVGNGIVGTHPRDRR